MTRRQCHAEIAADAVEGERASARGRLLDQHRGADRMIDRRKHAERRQRDRQHDRARRQSRADERGAAAEIEQRHHVAPAPAVAKPARRQREHAKGEERGRAKRNQLGIAPAVDRGELDHDGGQDQHHVVIDRMREVDEADRQEAGPLFSGRRENCRRADHQATSDSATDAAWYPVQAPSSPLLWRPPWPGINGPASMAGLGRRGRENTSHPIKEGRTLNSLEWRMSLSENRFPLFRDMRYGVTLCWRTHSSIAGICRVTNSASARMRSRVRSASVRPSEVS